MRCARCSSSRSRDTASSRCRNASSSVSAVTPGSRGPDELRGSRPASAYIDGCNGPFTAEPSQYYNKLVTGDGFMRQPARGLVAAQIDHEEPAAAHARPQITEIGRASCRERVYSAVVAMP